MAKKKNTLSEWHHVIAAVITVAGGLLLVWWQTSKATTETQQMLQDFTETVRDSDELRNAVLRPLEGRWSYQLEWDRYFDKEHDPENKSEQFVSEGTADIRYFGDTYHILLGYENRNRKGTVFSVGVSIGTLSPNNGLMPTAGDVMNMRYAHRKSAGEVTTDGGLVDYDKVPEKTYEYVITDIELSSDGRIVAVYADFEVSISKGSVVFKRKQ